MQQEIVRVCLITGYLGAGKTTLLNRILANSEGIRAAVIVNDIGEVNIDAELIAKKGTVSVEEKSLIPLTNGCICCTLSDDLAKQLSQLADSGLYNYIIIEASGICEPIPIAQTISMICKENSEDGLYMKMDNVIAVVDCARMLQEFENGRKLMREAIEEDDIENLLIQQIEFCNTILLNKTDLVTEDELDELKAIIRTLQKEAVMIETQQAGAKIEDLIHTDRFDLNRSMAAAGWVDAIQSFNAADAGRDGHDHEDHDHEAHDHEDHAHEDHDHEAHDHEDHGHESHAHGGHHHHHDHHHHHHDGESHILEYGISTFVYFRRRPFNRDKLVELCDYWPHSIIRCKGMIWYEHEPNVSFMFEQAGRQITESPSGVFLAAAPEKVQQRMLRQYPQIRDMWDETYGDRMIKLVFIGKDMDEEALTLRLDACLGK
ncbi:MAG: GTP-binding protein [Lachnospiraceae bacterium]|nr:GTP-binding protein [Lachnospiraceae bacterium]